MEKVFVKLSRVTGRDLVMEEFVEEDGFENRRRCHRTKAYS